MLIGLPLSTSKTQFFVNQAYVNYIHDAGLEAMNISPRNNTERIVNICDGLLLPGGIDIDPIYYDEDNYSSYSVDPEKDAFERKLFHDFLIAGKPVFGICRGLQLIAWELMISTNTGQRLSFSQHIDDHALARDLNLERNVRSHSVYADLTALYGKTGHQNQNVRTYVNSMHHQCLLYDGANNVDNGDLAAINFEVVAHTRIGLEKKKKNKIVIVEAFRLDWADSKILAVQWHPEELSDVRLLSNFFRKQKEVVENVGH